MTQLTDSPPSAGRDSDEEYFARQDNSRVFLRQANPGEWPEDNELLTSPPFTLVVWVRPGLILKFGAWRNNANTKNTYVQLNKGRIPVATYLEYLAQQGT